MLSILPPQVSECSLLLEIFYNPLSPASLSGRKAPFSQSLQLFIHKNHSTVTRYPSSGIKQFGFKSRSCH